MPLKRQKKKCLINYLCTDPRYRRESGRDDGANKHGILDPRGPAPLDCLPGTEAKIELMTDRVARGYLPFRPDDPSHLDLSEEMAAALTVQPHHAKSEPGQNGNAHEHNGDDEE